MDTREHLARIRAASVARERAHNEYKAAIREAVEDGVREESIALLSLGLDQAAAALELPAVLARRRLDRRRVDRRGRGE